MTVHEGFFEVPMLYFDDDDVITWEWFKNHCSLNREIRVDGGFLIPIRALEEHYIAAFRSYIDFQYYDNDPYTYDILMSTLGIISSFVEIYIGDHYFVYISSSFI